MSMPHDTEWPDDCDCDDCQAVRRFIYQDEDLAELEDADMEKCS